MADSEQDPPHLFHLAVLADWEAAGSTDYTVSTLGRSLEEEGFIHCSFAFQVQQIADLVYRGRHDVVLLEIDPQRLIAPVKVESLDGAEAFPHIYGPLNREAVIRATPLRLRADGTVEVVTDQAG